MSSLNDMLRSCEIMYLLHQGGKSYEEIAQELKTSRHYVAKVANKYHYKRLDIDGNVVTAGRAKGKPHRRYNWGGEDAYKMRLEYMKGNKATGIAKQFGIPTRYVEYVINDWIYTDYCPEGWVSRPNKYPKELVEAIRNEPKEMTYDKIVEKYQVPKSLVSVVRNKNWR